MWLRERYLAQREIKYNEDLISLGKTLLRWSELKPDNKELSNVVRLVNQLAFYANSLEERNMQLEADLRSLSDKYIDKLNETRSIDLC